MYLQEERSNFEIGRTPAVSDSILGDTRHPFLLTLYNFKNIERARPPPPGARPLTYRSAKLKVVFIFKLHCTKNKSLSLFLFS